MRARRHALAALMLLGLGGCPPGRPGIEPPEQPMPMGFVIARVNENNEKMDFLLRAGGLSARIKYVDRSGPATLELTGVLLYRKPRDLYAELKHTLDITPVMELGSNNEEFWLWGRREGCYWWGRHAQMAEYVETESDIPVRPDHLLEMLGLQTIPVDTAGPHGPAMRVEAESYELSYLDTDETGQVYFSRVICIDRRWPHLICRVTHFDPQGRPTVSASLSDHQMIEGSDVLAARKIDIQWPQKQSEARLEFLTMKRFDKPGIEKYFVSPLEKGEESLERVIRVDEPVPPIPDPVPGSTQPASSTP